MREKAIKIRPVFCRVKFTHVMSSDWVGGFEGAMEFFVIGEWN